MVRRRLRIGISSLTLICAFGLFSATPALAFGEDGAFNPRWLITGSSKGDAARITAFPRWSAEVTKRTSAPARLVPTTVRADEQDLLAEPFAYWSGDKPVEPLTPREIRGLQRFLALGGVLVVDDFAPDAGEFTRTAKREIARVVTDSLPVPIGDENILLRTFYLLKHPTGRVEGTSNIEAILRKGNLEVIFLSRDLAGALATSPANTPLFDVSEAQRERAIRLAVNLAMYVLCSNYKDDQVHATALMRRRSSEAP